MIKLLKFLVIIFIVLSITGSVYARTVDPNIFFGDEFNIQKDNRIKACKVYFDIYYCVLANLYALKHIQWNLYYYYHNDKKIFKRLLTLLDNNYISRYDTYNFYRVERQFTKMIEKQEMSEKKSGGT